MYFVYFAISLKNRKVYVGKTEKEPGQRVLEHNQGTSPWTRSNGPFKLIYYEKYICKEDASARELFYKSGIGKKIKKLIIETMSL